MNKAPMYRIFVLTPETFSFNTNNSRITSPRAFDVINTSLWTA